MLNELTPPFGGNLYSLPGGQITIGETATQTVIREARESINIALKPDSLDCVHVMHRKCNDPEFFAAIFKPRSWAGGTAL